MEPRTKRRSDRSMIQRALCILAVLVNIAVAADPVGVVTGGGTFQISGVQISGGLCPAMLLVMGDEVTTSNAPAFITLNDHSRLLLFQDSQLKLETEAGYLKIHVLRGSISYHLATGPRAQVVVQGRTVEPANEREGYARWAPVNILEKLGKSCPPEKAGRFPGSRCGPGSVF